MAHVVSRRARLRLPKEAYADPEAVYSISTGTARRAPVFTSDTIARTTIGTAVTHAEASGVSLWAYCVMPDHVHLLLSASATCDVVTYVGQFKSLTYQACRKHGVLASFWQKRFWDRFTRNDEHIDTAVRYVLDNPVVAGLVRVWHEYPYSGASDAKWARPEKSGGQAPALRFANPAPGDH